MIPLKIDASHAFPGEIGHGDTHHAALEKAARQLAGEITSGARPFLRLPREKDDLPGILAKAKALRGEFGHVVVIGTGGSSLGARCLGAIAKPASGKTGSPQLHFLENVDPHTLEELLALVPLKETAFIFISKSGGTLETLGQAMLITAQIEKTLGRDAVKHACTVITEPKDSALTLLADHYGMEKLTHDPNLGGRYSVLSNVGLLPAAVLGLDIAAIRAGAAQLSEGLAAKPTLDHPAVEGAHFQFHHMNAGRNVHVIMPYVDRLKLLGDWFRQLTAESLGKEGHGFTPLSALGAVDHHSMLQLFLGGPDDKFYSFVTLERQSSAYTVERSLASLAKLDHLAGKGLGDMIDASARGTIETILAHKLPTRQIVLPTLNEESLGALLMLFMLETPLTALLMGIDAFDQPEVEESKQRTMKYLKGEAKAA